MSNTYLHLTFFPGRRNELGSRCELYRASTIVTKKAKTTELESHENSCMWNHLLMGATWLHYMAYP
jgi:hypothetical protein